MPSVAVKTGCDSFFLFITLRCFALFDAAGSHLKSSLEPKTRTAANPVSQNISKLSPEGEKFDGKAAAYILIIIWSLAIKKARPLKSELYPVLSGKNNLFEMFCFCKYEYYKINNQIFCKKNYKGLLTELIRRFLAVLAFSIAFFVSKLNMVLWVNLSSFQVIVRNAISFFFFFFHLITSSLDKPY